MVSNAQVRFARKLDIGAAAQTFKFDSTTGVAMVPRICEVKVLEDYRLWLKFEDGKKGEVDLKDELWGEVFEPLLDPLVFRQVKLDPELKTLSWANGADFAPEFLYECIRS